MPPISLTLRLIVAAAFLLSAVVQLNDPDPLRWAGIYAAAAAAALASPAWRFTAPARVALGAGALFWGTGIWWSMPDAAEWGMLFTSAEMVGDAVEKTREFTGLLVAGLLLLGLAAFERPARM